MLSLFVKFVQYSSLRKLPISEARRLFTELATRAEYLGETTVVTKHGKDVAAIVPMSKLQPEPGRSEKKKAPSSSSSGTTSAKTGS